MSEYFVLAYCAGYGVETYTKSEDKRTAVNNALIKLEFKLRPKRNRLPGNEDLPVLLVVYENSHPLELDGKENSLTIYCLKKDDIKEVNLEEIKDIGLDPRMVIRSLTRLAEWIKSKGFRYPKSIANYLHLINSV